MKWLSRLFGIGEEPPIKVINHNPVITEKDLTLKIHKNDKLRISQKLYCEYGMESTPNRLYLKWCCHCPTGKGWNGWGDTPFEAYIDWIKHNGTK